MTIGQRIRQKRLELGLTQEELADAVGYRDRSSINKIEKGNRNLMQADILALAKALKTTPGYIMGWTGLPKPKISETVDIRIIGDIAAGYDSEPVEGEWEEIEVPKSYLGGRSLEDFSVMTVKGDSMAPEYKDGDQILVLMQSSLDSGQIGVVLYGDCATLKKVVYDDDGITLVPLNDAYKPLKIEDKEHFLVLGIPKKLIRSF